MKHPSGTSGFSNLFSDALAEFAMHSASLHFLGKAKVWPAFMILCEAGNRDDRKHHCRRVASQWFVRVKGRKAPLLMFTKITVMWNKHVKLSDAKLDAIAKSGKVEMST